MHYLGSTVQSADIVAAILSWCLAINSCMGVLLRTVIGLGTTCNDTQMGNAFRLRPPGSARRIRFQGYNDRRSLCSG